MKSFKTIKFIDLNWEDVDYDLNLYSDDLLHMHSVVGLDDNFSKTWNDDLVNITQEYKKFGYTEHNTKIWKSTNQVQRLVFKWQQRLIDQLPLDNPIVTLTRQDPGQILPWHYDRHFMLKNLYPDDKRMIARILVFMQDWKIGHVLQIHDDLLVKWKKGQAVIWHPDTYHVSANIGLETKWTCNITGFVNDRELEILLDQAE